MKQACRAQHLSRTDVVYYVAQCFRKRSSGWRAAVLAIEEVQPARRRPQHLERCPVFLPPAPHCFTCAGKPGRDVPVRNNIRIRRVPAKTVTTVACGCADKRSPHDNTASSRCGET